MENNEKTPLTKEEKAMIEELVEKFLSLLEIEGTFTVEQIDEIIDVAIDTKDSGMVIGYHGEILESLQLILSLAIAKKIGRFMRVSIEVGGYKKSRTEYLEKLAQQAKERAIEENSEQVLSSLKSWERRVVHMLLQNDDQVVSESAGEGKDRVLIVKPKN